jgi:hypothetical protein
MTQIIRTEKIESKIAMVKFAEGYSIREFDTEVNEKINTTLKI